MRKSLFFQQFTLGVLRKCLVVVMIYSCFQTVTMISAYCYATMGFTQPLVNGALPVQVPAGAGQVEHVVHKRSPAGFGVVGVGEVVEREI
jgi:hypothetical protein